jgi:cysteine sulfinate desulfinase/cysteine desulfurase-like protein
MMTRFGIAGVSAHETIVFTSGGTETDNYTILVWLSLNMGKHIITVIEHHAVLQLVKN